MEAKPTCHMWKHKRPPGKSQSEPHGHLLTRPEGAVHASRQGQWVRCTRVRVGTGGCHVGAMVVPVLTCPDWSRLACPIPGQSGQSVRSVRPVSRVSQAGQSGQSGRSCQTCQKSHFAMAVLDMSKTVHSSISLFLD